MGLVLQLVETGASGRRRGIDVLELDWPRDLRGIASLGLTLPEAKQLLARARFSICLNQVTRARKRWPVMAGFRLHRRHVGRRPASPGHARWG